MPLLFVSRVLCVLLVLFLAPAVRAETFDKIVAVVNGEAILYSDLQDQLKYYERTTPGLDLDSPAKRSMAEKEVLEQLIRDKLAAEEIKKFKIGVSNLEVDEAIAQLKQDRGLSEDQFKRMLDQEGKTPEQFKEGVKKELERGRLLDRVLKSKTVITEEQINTEMGIKSGPDSKKAKAAEKETAMETARLALIVIPKPKGASDSDKDKAKGLVKDIRSEIKKDGNFADLAKKYSRGPAVDNGGDIGFVEMKDLSPEIRDAVKSLKAGDISDVVESASAYYIVKLIDTGKSKSAPEVKSSETMARDKVRRDLYNKELSRRFEEWIRDLQSRASIQIFM